jgi:predicted DNA-binding protein (UPF0251 family)
MMKLKFTVAPFVCVVVFGLLMSHSGRESWLTLRNLGLISVVPVITITLKQALLRLPLKKRTPLVLKYYYDYSYEEIADILSCPIGTVRSRINRAREQMRNMLYASGTLQCTGPSNIAERGRT